MNLSLEIHTSQGLLQNPSGSYLSSPCQAVGMVGKRSETTKLREMARGGKLGGPVHGPQIGAHRAKLSRHLAPDFSICLQIEQTRV